MELIVGGAYQGKEEYARNLFPDISWIDGDSCSEEEILHCQGIWNFQRYLERKMEQGKPVEGLGKLLYEKNPDMIIVTDEIGCGIVPLDPFQRAFREQAGRVCTELAERSLRVHRVICGVGMVIKR